MPARKKRAVVFVHGWSVSDTRTYGGLPERLRVEAAGAGLDLDLREIFLGRYVSFRDEVRVEDVSRAFEAAVRRELSGLLARRGRFACVTHSTGGPVIREWWRRYYGQGDRNCPMSHLVMLAPPNFGSALAQLGRGRLHRLNSWFHGMEPGTGILDWLELGSPEAWRLNLDWIRSLPGSVGGRGVYPFVLAGQTLDRTMYDHLVSLTGESGSDGAVRVASTNLNATHIRLEQGRPRRIRGGKGRYHAPRLVLAEHTDAFGVPMRVVAGASHSGTSQGIQRGVRKTKGHPKGAETVSVILDCLKVATKREYAALRKRFERETAKIQERQRIEVGSRVLLPDTTFIHDRYSMVIVRIQDEKGYAVEDVDLLLTAGKDHDPDRLPADFLAHVQRNRRHGGTVTYFFNYDVMRGCEPVPWKGKTLREKLTGVNRLGMKVEPRPTTGFVHYLPCDLQASAGVLEAVLRPNQTTLIDLVLRRVVREGVFRLDRGTKRRNFRKDPPGPPV